jgi:hypothetical protein
MTTQTNPKFKPSVTISLPPVLEAWCRWLYNTPSGSIEIVVNRKHDVGKHIFSHILGSPLPLHRTTKKNPVVFVLPEVNNSDQYLNKHFLYVDEWGETKINDFIRSEFNQWVRRRFEIGYFYGWRQDQITDAIIRGLNIRDNAVNFDAIKKLDYRNRRKVEEKRFYNLLSVDC